jgi:hypothetical protein
MTTLTTEEKINIINSHKKSLLYAQYNSEIDLVQENAKTTPDSVVISNINKQISEANKQLTALDAELASLPPIEE